jgi:hypothetical protein
MKAWTAVTNIMTDITNANTTKNVYFHCRVGADRTGTVAYLLEGLLGVPDEMRYEEYALTNVSGLYDRTRYYKQKSSTNNLKFVYMMGYVKTTQDIYDWYMSNPNASASLVQAFRTAMTVPTNQQQQNSPQNSPQQILSNSASASNRSVASTNNGSDDDDSSYISTSHSNSGSGKSSYSEPLGVEETSYGDLSDSVSGVGLAVATAAAAGAGVSYALAKRRDDDEDEE